MDGMLLVDDSGAHSGLASPVTEGAAGVGELNIVAATSQQPGDAFPQVGSSDLSPNDYGTARSGGKRDTPSKSRTPSGRESQRQRTLLGGGHVGAAAAAALAIEEAGGESCVGAMPMGSAAGTAVGSAVGVATNALPAAFASAALIACETLGLELGAPISATPAATTTPVATTTLAAGPAAAGSAANARKRTEAGTTQKCNISAETMR